MSLCLEAAISFISCFQECSVAAMVCVVDQVEDVEEDGVCTHVYMERAEVENTGTQGLQGRTHKGVPLLPPYRTADSITHSSAPVPP